MCIYHYCYFSDCRHGELTRISYCDEATALGQPRFGRHSRNDADATGGLKDSHGASSFRPSALQNNSSSSSQTHSQQQNQSQHYNSMSTLTPSPAGRSLTLDAAVQSRAEQAHSQASLIPRSALVDGSRTRRANTLSDARFLLDSQGYSNVSIDLPLDEQSSLDLEVITHDVSPDHPCAPSSHPVHSPASPVLGTARQYPPEQGNHSSPIHAISQLGQSPRKPIPAHWLPKATAPNLATAQRAKERTHKKGSAIGSSSDMKTLRLTRSSVDVDRSHGKEGATYLTKEALAAVESAVAPPASPQTPLRNAGSPSKPAWNSPVTPPARGSARQHPTQTLKMSPTKSTYLTAESMSAGHSRTSSSIATSTGKTSFHTADGSPVRSPASTVHSFQSAVEYLEDQNIFMFDLSADMEGEQLPRHLNTSPTSGIKYTGGTHASSSKPMLSIQTPNLHFGPGIGYGPLVSPPIDANASANNRSAGLVSATDTSRIPRVSTLARNTDTSRTFALQRAQSVRVLQSKIKLLQDADVHLDEATLSNILTSDVSHVHAAMEIDQEPTCSQAQKVDHLLILKENSSPTTEPESQEEFGSCEDRSDKATLLNAATHTINVGKVSEDSAPVPERGRSECTGSDLRPTAVEFVPRSSSAILPTEPADELGNLAPLQNVAGLPDMTMLDRNGIPFLWYMYGVQFAYEQGFRNGRPKSPRKHKPKVKRGSVSSPGDASHAVTSQLPDTTTVSAIRPSFEDKQRISSAELMPSPPVPRHQFQPKYDDENKQSNFQPQKSTHDMDDIAASSPFANQINLIDQHTALSNRTHATTPRHYNIDLTRVSNVGLPTGPRSMQAPVYHTIPRHHHRANRHPGNGLYGGRGNAAGVPLDATTPFPNPTPPQGRQGHGPNSTGGAADYPGYTIGKEACGIVDITTATERIGGGPCNACDPHH